MNVNGFWDNIDYANKLSTKLSKLEKELGKYNNILSRLENINDIKRAQGICNS